MKIDLEQEDNRIFGLLAIVPSVEVRGFACHTLTNPILTLDSSPHQVGTLESIQRNSLLPSLVS